MEFFYCNGPCVVSAIKYNRLCRQINNRACVEVCNLLHLYKLVKEPESKKLTQIYNKFITITVQINIKCNECPEKYTGHTGVASQMIPVDCQE